MHVKILNKVKKTKGYRVPGLNYNEEDLIGNLLAYSVEGRQILSEDFKQNVQILFSIPTKSVHCSYRYNLVPFSLSPHITEWHRRVGDVEGWEPGWTAASPVPRGTSHW